MPWTSLACSYENYKETPLPTCVAMSQGYIGIEPLQNAIKYELYKRNHGCKGYPTILSQGGGGDPEDEAFKKFPQNPSAVPETEAEARKKHGKRDSLHGRRR